jgi:hypothetical protein
MSYSLKLTLLANGMLHKGEGKSLLSFCLSYPLSPASHIEQLEKLSNGASERNGGLN